MLQNGRGNSFSSGSAIVCSRFTRGDPVKPRRLGWTGPGDPVSVQASNLKVHDPYQYVLYMYVRVFRLINISCVAGRILFLLLGVFLWLSRWRKRQVYHRATLANRKYSHILDTTAVHESTCFLGTDVPQYMEQNTIVLGW